MLRTRRARPLRPGCVCKGETKGCWKIQKGKANQWTGKGKGVQQGPAVQKATGAYVLPGGKASAKGFRFQGTCDTCWGWGQKRAECSSVARACGVEDATLEGVASYAAQVQTQTTVQVGTVWSIAHVLCRNRYHALADENDDIEGNAGRGEGSSRGRGSGGGPSVESRNPERAPPDNAGLSDVVREGSRGGGNAAEGNLDHRTPKLFPRDKVGLPKAGFEDCGGGVAACLGDRKKISRGNRGRKSRARRSIRKERETPRRARDPGETSREERARHE